MVINKALYGLHLSGQRVNKLLGRCLLSLGFECSKCEANIWIRYNQDCYKYVSSYMDDLTLVIKYPEKFLEQLQGELFNFKLKGSTTIDGALHLGCAFMHDQHGVLYMDPNQYIKQVEEAYLQIFDDKPNTHVQSPLDPGYNPKLDTSNFLDKEHTEIYQSLIGAMQWTISIGHWDIQSAVTTMSSFCAQAKIGHLLHIKQIYCYLIKFCNY